MINVINDKDWILFLKIKNKKVILDKIDFIMVNNLIVL